MDEKLYLVCDDCGEGFDSLQTAYDNHPYCEEPMIETRFFVRTEGEAM